MVLVEPLIKSSGGAVKPDPVFWNSEASYVLDVAVEGNGFDPDTRHERKLAKYYVQQCKSASYVHSIRL